MKIGFIGAGKAGCSMGKYFQTKAAKSDLQITGYYSSKEEDARWAAKFTESVVFHTIEEVIKENDAIVISTPDGAIKTVWESLKKDGMKDKIFCHLSGSLSSDVFSGIEKFGAYPISIHPMFAFCNKESVYQQLNKVSFTLEGHEKAVLKWKKIFDNLGNSVIEISKEVKPKYHAAASMLSNQVISILSVGYELLLECGFSEDEARNFSSVLVRDNVEHVIQEGCIQSLTGPIERSDLETIRKHLAIMNDKQQDIYKSCGRRLLEIAKQKNPDRDYKELDSIM